MQENKKNGIIIDAEIVSEEQGEKQADAVAGDVFGSEDNAQKTGGIIKSFVYSYEQNKLAMPVGEWLVKEFGKYPALWKNDEEIKKTAHEVIDTIINLNKTKVELYAHLDAGKTKESFFARKIEEGAKAAGVVNVGEYAAGIDKALTESNNAMMDSVTRGDGHINMIPNLDGFIAEQHHVNTFNIDAAAKGSSLRAEVLRPEPGGLYTKNSLDIQIKDTVSGKVVKRYQAKYGADSEATKIAFEKGDYRGQRKLVAEGQAEDIEGAVERIEADGISSKPLSKDAAKALQDDFQKEQTAREQKLYEWSDVNKVAVCKQIGKQAVVAAVATVAFQGARILGRRVWNFLTGKENRPLSEDMQDYFESSIKSGSNVGIQTAVAGAVVVAVKNGWVRVLQSTPAGMIANIVYVGMENAKVMYKVLKGELSPLEGLDALGNVTTTVIGSICGAGHGFSLGAAIGTAILPGIGTAVGGFIGAVAGGIAGSSIGSAIYEGGKMLVKAGGRLLKSAYEVTKSFVKKLNPLNWFA